MIIYNMYMHTHKKTVQNIIFTTIKSKLALILQR